MIRNEIKQTSSRNFRLSIGLPILVVAIVAWYISVSVFHASSTGSMSAVVSVVPLMTMAHMFSSLDPRMISSFVLM